MVHPGAFSCTAGQPFVPVLSSRRWRPWAGVAESSVEAAPPRCLPALSDPVSCGRVSVWLDMSCGHPVVVFAGASYSGRF
ncbi:hypothetical protein CG740_21135 [Streptomyces sp. CB01201]|nr:hypothetical protein CG740_21135 [Streptomyces sp. CB01201]